MKTLAYMNWKPAKKFKDSRRAIVEKVGYGPNWRKQRAVALKRDNYTCVKCGHKGMRSVSKYGRWDVAVNHRRKIAWFTDSSTGTVDWVAANDISNLETLCQNCHAVADGHKRMVGFTPLA
jgi:5-methylcytosine-specific restriction endonuclease McrA